MKFFGLSFLSFFSLLFCSVGTLPAQTDASAEAAVRAYYQALNAGNWDRVAALTHPDALNDVVELVRKIAGANEKSLNSLQAALGESLLLDTLDRVAPRRVYAAFIGALMETPFMKGTVAGSKVDVVGSVMEGETAHVVIRVRTSMIADKATETMQVHSARLHNGEWLTLLDEQLSSMRSVLTMLLEVAGKISDEAKTQE